MSAEQTVRIDGPITSTISNTPSTPVYISTGTPSTIINAYVYSQAEQSGVVAANNFISLFNPVGSGKLITLGGVFISSYAVGDIDATVQSMRGFRVTAASAGTPVAANTICSFDTAKPDTSMEVRVGNPTVTLGDAIFNSPPFIGAVKSSLPFVHQVPVPAGGGPFLFRPGEGMVLRTAAGDVDTRWNLSVAWTEM